MRLDGAREPLTFTYYDEEGAGRCEGIKQAK